MSTGSEPREHLGKRDELGIQRNLVGHGEVVVVESSIFDIARRRPGHAVRPVEHVSGAGPAATPAHHHRNSASRRSDKNRSTSADEYLTQRGVMRVNLGPTPRLRHAANVLASTPSRLATSVGESSRACGPSLWSAIVVIGHER
jgi:hypothetical protein